MPRQLLIVDDDPTIRTSLAEALASRGTTEVRVAEGPHQALALLDRGVPDVVLSDVRMPGMDGIAFLQLLHERAPSADVILMTAYDDMATVVSAMRGGAVEFLVKPLHLQQVRRVLDTVFDDRLARERAPRAPAAELALGDLAGRDPQMIAVYKLIGQAAKSRAPVLIRGESGTGKELVARAIHANSGAAPEPFVRVNCALPTPQLESGWFRGTILLDEVGDASAEFQAKLLRLIQDRPFEPLGGAKTEHTEARMIATTHRDLEGMLEDGSFREDLYYRLRVMEIALPSLRERRNDIPVLAAELTRRRSRASGTTAPVLSSEALARLLEHDWPGNVRELENCLAHAAGIASGGVIRPEHLAIRTPRERTKQTVPAAATRLAIPSEVSVLSQGELFAGRYEILEEVGSGGMGKVYRALDRELAEQVAVKVLRRELVHDPALVERFKLEIRLARQITDKHVVRAYDIGEWDGRYYLTMEFVDGMTVRDLLDSRGRLDIGATLAIATQLAQSLVAAHEQGVIHRDIKPQNLMLDRGGVLKVLDFGVARLAAGRSDLTEFGMIVGTPAYMAPEQMLSETVDERTDLYAAGAVLFECLTGRTAFDAGSVAARIASQLRDHPVEPREFNPEVPPALSALVLRLLSRQREDRPASATTLLSLLSEISWDEHPAFSGRTRVRKAS